MQQAILNNFFSPSQCKLVASNPTPIQGDHGDNSQSRDPPIVFLCEHDLLLKTHVKKYNALLNWAHRSVEKHTTHMIDHTIYSVIEEWNSAKMACNYVMLSLTRSNWIVNYNLIH